MYLSDKFKIKNKQYLNLKKILMNIHEQTGNNYQNEKQLKNKESINLQKVGFNNQLFNKSTQIVDYTV